MKQLIAIFLFLYFMLAQSCSQKPYACFDTDVDEDSIRVNQPVTFSAFCSSRADSYYWEFYKNEDSAFFSPRVQKVFYDTGTVHVYLLVTGGKNISSVSKDIRVNP